MQECNYRENQCCNCRIIIRHFIYSLSTTVAAAVAVAAGVVAVAAVLVVLVRPRPFWLHCDNSFYGSKGPVRGPLCCRYNRGVSWSCSPTPSQNRRTQRSSRLYNKISESTTRVAASIGKQRTSHLAPALAGSRDGYSKLDVSEKGRRHGNISF